MPGAPEKKLAEHLNESLRTWRVNDDDSSVRDFCKLTQDLRGDIEAWGALAKQTGLDTAVDLVQPGNKKAGIETAIRLACATNWLLSDFINVGEDSLSFAEFKAALKPKQAGRMAKMTMQMGAKARTKTAELSDDPDDPYLSELAFYLLAVSLYAKAGVDQIDSDLEARIDSLIVQSVFFLEKVQARMAANSQ